MLVIGKKYNYMTPESVKLARGLLEQPGPVTIISFIDGNFVGDNGFHYRSDGTVANDVLGAGAHSIIPE